MKTLEKIKPCPFCGKRDFSVMYSPEGSHARVVKCWSCGAIGPYGASNNNLAIEFWNDRKYKDIIESQVE